MRFRVFTEPWQGASYEQQLAMANVAEECGFEGFLRSDHLRYMGDGLKSGELLGLPGPTDAWITLAGLARDTSKIRLGTLVTPITHDWPGLLALRVAQVDNMSKGRVELGIGTGWDELEHTYFGVPYPTSLNERFDRLEEALEVITGLWSTPVGERFSYSGRHVTIVNSPALPKPTQSPHPPIVIGGVGKDRTPKLVARFANEYNLTFGRPGMTPDVARAQFARVRTACEAIGRDPAEVRMSAAVVMCCGRGEAEIRRRSDRLGLKSEGLTTSVAMGTPAEVVEKLHRYGRDGAETINMSFMDFSDLDHLRLVAEEVVPHLLDK